MSEHAQPKAVQSQGLMNLAERFGDARSAKPAAGEILILCPRTNTPVTTGLRIAWVVFKSLPHGGPSALSSLRSNTQLETRRRLDRNKCVVELGQCSHEHGLQCSTSRR
jgi:hypothetical protein